MQILSVTLRNFKTHRDRTFEFYPGTNAICGENGAGKTSILEAIAWTLFNYQGDYAKEDLIRNGSGSAQALVTFVSSRDGRTYEVQRCTLRGYTLFDPQLGTRLPYSRIQDEVLPWLRQHLGVSADTDLPKLFARTIGVPQGTLTADFLLPIERRKTIFDSVLKVEEYKEAFKQTNSLRRYAEAQTEAIKRELEHYEEELAPWEDLKTKEAELANTIHQAETQLSQLTETLEQLDRQRQSLQGQMQQLEALQMQQRSLAAEYQGQQQLLTRLNNELERTERAVAICENSALDHENYQIAQAEEQRLMQQQRQRQALEAKLRRLEADYQKDAASLTRLQVQLEELHKNENEIQQLQPQIQQQMQLEEACQALEQQLQRMQALHLEKKNLSQQLQQMEEQERQLVEAISRLDRLQTEVEEIAVIEQNCDRIQQQLSRVESARQFEAELRQLVEYHQHRWHRHRNQVQSALRQLSQLLESAPLLGQGPVEQLKHTLSTGLEINQTMIASIQTIVDDLAEQVDRVQLEQQLQVQRQQLEQLYQKRGAIAQRPFHQENLEKLGNHQQNLQQQLNTIDQQLKSELQLSHQLKEQSEQLQALGDPKSRQRWLEESLRQKPALLKEQQRLIAGQEPLLRQQTEWTAELEKFADLNRHLEQVQAAKQQHQTGYTQYLQHQQLAQGASNLQAEIAAAKAKAATLEQQMQILQAEYDTQKAKIDAESLVELESRYQDVRSQYDRLSGSLPQQQTRLQELRQQLSSLETTAQKRELAKDESKKRERIRRFINFARKAYKEAGPRITEQYVQSVAQEADRLFREILHRPNVALNWTRDYEILVQEGPNQRRFLNLSGGEQMCAALAVRLALLKVLADIDVAFFDEPTTNMDKARRESLAEAITRIKSFRQIFVISHDDTFEKATENLVRVERES